MMRMTGTMPAFILIHIHSPLMTFNSGHYCTGQTLSTHLLLLSSLRFSSTVSHSSTSRPHPLANQYPPFLLPPFFFSFFFTPHRSLPSLNYFSSSPSQLLWPLILPSFPVSLVPLLQNITIGYIFHPFTDMVCLATICIYHSSFDI